MNRRAAFLAILAAIVAPVVVGATPASAAACGVGFSDNGGGVCTVTLVATGALQTRVVPAGVIRLSMVVTGGQGGWSLDQGTGSGAPGGLGGRESASVPVTPGSTLSIVVGQTGGVADLINPPPQPFGGGGAPGGAYGGYGGGGTFVFSSAGALIAAGGGGGSGYDYNPDASGQAIVQQAPGGAGSGAAPAGDGHSVAFCCDPTFPPPTHVAPGGGKGATPTAPGAGGVPVGANPGFGPSDGNPGQGPATGPGNLGVGGAGPAGSGASGCFSSWAGGGGGGYFGGGSGGNIACDLEGGGGGGGAGYVIPTATNASSATGVQADDGHVTLTYNLANLVPSPPTGVRALPAPTSTSTGPLRVSFTPGSGNGGVITSFTATCTSSNGGVTRSGSASASPVTVNALTTAKSYRCTVRATSARGTGVASAPSSPMIVGAPSAPTGVQAARVSSGRLRVTFTPGANNGKVITSYSASCSSSNGGVAGSKAGTASPVVVIGLTPAKSYRCTVKAINARGPGPASAASAPVVA